MLQYVVVCCSVLQCVAMLCSVAQCCAVWRSVVQCYAAQSCVVLCVAVCEVATIYASREHILQRANNKVEIQVNQCLCCSVLQRVAACCSMLQCVAVCCSVLQIGAACCSVLQCVATCGVAIICALREHILQRSSNYLRLSVECLQVCDQNSEARPACQGIRMYISIFMD